MSDQNQLSVQTAPKASDQLATFLGIEKGMMLETLKAQCFKGKRPDEVTDAQLAAFVSTANVLQVNPLVPGMLYAYPEKNGGITPILGPDGSFKKLDEFIAAGKLEGFECVVFPEDVTQRPTHATATIFRKNAKPATYTALFSEWAVGNSPVWGQKPRHMLWLRAIKQCARQVIHGLPMDDEEYKMSGMQNVTDTATEEKVERAPMKERAKKGASVVRGNDKVVDAVAETVVTEPAVTKMVTPEPTKPAPEPVKEAAPASEPDSKVVSFADAAAATEAKASLGGELAGGSKSESKPEVVQRALLHPDEVITVVANINQFKVVVGKRDGKDHPYVTADIESPELKGQVSQTDGGVGADGKPLPVWQLEQAVKVVVRGKKFKSGALVNVVDSIEIANAGQVDAEV